MALDAHYFELLIQLFASENKNKKLYVQLNKACYTDELKKAFSPAETAIEDHLQRLTLLMKAHELKKNMDVSELDQLLISNGTAIVKQKVKDRMEKDFSIVQFATLHYQVKINAYTALLQLAKALELDPDVTLIDQCLAEHKNNCAYIFQIASNIIYPDLKA